jgi:hypothetical protein
MEETRVRLLGVGIPSFEPVSEKKKKEVNWWQLSLFCWYNNRKQY